MISGTYATLKNFQTFKDYYKIFDSLIIIYINNFLIFYGSVAPKFKILIKVSHFI